jgi:exonuclease SbcC
MLSELQMSGRMIGVISHVSELKEQMPVRVEVRASRHGSSVDVKGALAT